MLHTLLASAPAVLASAAARAAALPRVAAASSRLLSSLADAEEAPRSLNLCHAINDALHVALERDPTCARQAAGCARAGRAGRRLRRLRRRLVTRGATSPAPPLSHRSALLPLSDLTGR